MIFSNPDITFAYEQLKKNVFGQKSNAERCSSVEAIKILGYNLPNKAIGKAVAEHAELLAQPDVLLIGSVAFEAYCGMAGLLGLPRTLVSTKDVDLAYGGVVIVSGQPPMSDDNDYQRIAASGVTIDIVMPQMEGHEAVEAFPYAPAITSYGLHVPEDRRLLFIDPIKTVIAHGAGVVVTAPHPLNFAMHKLVVSADRLSSAKIHKDHTQARILLNHFSESARKTANIAAHYFAFRHAALKEVLENALAEIMPDLTPQAARWLEQGRVQSRELAFK